MGDHREEGGEVWKTAVEVGDGRKATRWMLERVGRLLGGGRGRMEAPRAKAGEG